MSVESLTVDPLTGLPVVILLDEVGGTAFAITVGTGEASAIAAELDGIEFERPTTHRLACRLLEAADAHLDTVEIRDFVDGTFYASLHLRLADGRRVCEEARPSDAIALALHTGAQLLVSIDVLKRVGRPATEFEPAVTLVESAFYNEGANEYELELEPMFVPSGRPGLARPGSANEDSELLDRLEPDAFGKWKM